LAAGPDQVQAARYQTEQSVGGTIGKKNQRRSARNVFVILVHGSFAHAEGVEEWTQMKMSLRVREMQFHWRRVGVLAILFQRIVRCKKAGAGNNAMNDTAHDEPFGVVAPFVHFATRS